MAFTTARMANELFNTGTDREVVTQGHLAVADEDAVAQGGEGGDVSGQLAVLALAQQLLLAQLIDAQDVAAARQQAALEGRECPRGLPHRRPVHQLQPPPRIPQPVYPDEAVCSTHAPEEATLTVSKSGISSSRRPASLSQYILMKPSAPDMH